MGIRNFLTRYLRKPGIDKLSSIGKNTYIGDFSEIIDSEIGDFCSIAPFVSIGNYNHYLYYVTTHPFINHARFGYINNDYFTKEHIDSEKCRPVIGNDVWIGTHSVILRGTHIGDGAVIGAGSVVTKDIPPYAIAVGSPCKVIKYRFDREKIEALMRIKWWNWDDNKLKTSVEDFYDVNKFIIKYDIK